MPDGRAPVAVAPTTSAYPDIHYSNVSPFSAPTQCEPSLLTPVSTGGSPLRHPHKTHQPPPQYPPHTAAHTADDSSASATSMYAWSSPYDMHPSTTQTASSMPPPATVSQAYLASSYLAEDRRSPAPPPPMYLGGFAVSECSDQPVMPQPPGPMYLNLPETQHNESLMLRSEPLPIAMQREMERRQQPPGSFLGHPDAQPQRDEPRETIEETYAAVQSYIASAGDKTSPRRRMVQTGGPRMRKARVGSRKASQSKDGAQDGGPQEEHKNCRGEEVMPTLKDTCPEEERCIFESRWRHRHTKGQDMWDSIQDDFEKKFDKHGKEMLQMKYKRGRTKYIEWLPEDVNILRDAWMSLEKDRYQMLLDKFHELGGSRNMSLNASDIEVKLVNDMKLEEGLYIEHFGDVAVRRRRKLTTRKRARGMDDDSALNDELRSGPFHNNVSSEEEVLNQVHGRDNGEWDANSNTGTDMMDIQMWGSRPMKEPGVVPHLSQYMVSDAQDAKSRVGPGGP